MPGYVPLTGCAAGAKCSGPVSSANPLPVAVSGTSGASGTPTQPSVSVGTTSGAVLAASTATTFIKLCVPLGFGRRHLGALGWRSVSVAGRLGREVAERVGETD